MMRAILAALSLCLVVTFAGSAEAHARQIQVRHSHPMVRALAYGLVHMMRTAEGASRVIGYRPRDCYGMAWCGCYMRHLVDRDPGPAYNLARNWAHYGRPTYAHVGAIVVWPHHVGEIVGRRNGRWLVLSGNDGNAVRRRFRSLGGAIALRAPGGRQ